MAKIHKKSKICSVCFGSTDDLYVIFHKTRRQTHKLCYECGESYILPFIDRELNNIRKNIRNYPIQIKCPGTTYSDIKNQCNISVCIKQIILPRFSLLETKISILFNVLSSRYNFLCMNDSCYAITNVAKNDNLKVFNNGYIKCHRCDTEWCSRCLCEPYHSDKTCIEYENYVSNSDISKYVLEKISSKEMKYCPSCKVPIEKTRNEHGKFVSCNKMLCENCNTKWCWLCEEKNIDYNHYNEKNNTLCSNHLWKDVYIEPINNAPIPIQPIGFNLNNIDNDFLFD